MKHAKDFVFRVYDFNGKASGVVRELQQRVAIKQKLSKHALLSIFESFSFLSFHSWTLSIVNHPVRLAGTCMSVENNLVLQ